MVDRVGVDSILTAEINDASLGQCCSNVFNSCRRVFGSVANDNCEVRLVESDDNNNDDDDDDDDDASVSPDAVDIRLCTVQSINYSLFKCNTHTITTTSEYVYMNTLSDVDSCIVMNDMTARI